MKPAFFPVIMGGRRGSVTQVFSPASLFTSGVQGAWYDPSDYTSLFQESAGKTAVTAVEQPVGLMLDKSQGLVLGSEATSGSWLNAHSTTFDTFTSTGPTGFTATTTGAKAPRVAVLASLPTAGWYWIEFTATFTGGSFSTVGVSNTGSPYSAAVATTVLPATGVAFKTLIYTSAAREYLTITFTASGASTLSVTGVSVKSLAGNHASQATPTSCPVLRARYNLLTYSEQFDNTAWTSSSTNVTISANTATAPDATTTADSITAVAGGPSFHYSRRGSSDTLTGTYTYSIYVKKNTSTWIFFTVNDGGVNYFNLDTGAFGTTPDTCAVVALSNGWYRISATRTLAAAPGNCGVGVANSNGGGSITATGTESVYVWGAMLNPGSSAGTYQQITTATSYATAEFAPYLAFDGVDDFLSAAYVQSAYPLTLTAGVNNDSIATASGAFVSVAQSDSVYKISRDNAVGTTDAQDRNATTITTNNISQAGNKFVLSQFETSTITQQVNGGTAITIANTNSFGTSVSIFLGKARPTNLFSSARDYGVVITNTVLTAAEKDSLKNYMGGKMGVTL